MTLRTPRGVLAHTSKMNAWHDVPWGTDVREFFNVIVEISEGSKVKRAVVSALTALAIGFFAVPASGVG